ncbi:MAG TPA: hypothetical protein PKM65_19570 [Spirochaetota bacterium]|nr:hypothetical protein [Spirochaetota bacterium]HNT12970.1 hypothetical protein [Spirochaetota bacterium]
MLRVSILILLAYTTMGATGPLDHSARELAAERTRLEETLRAAKMRVRETWRIRAGDFLRLLPTVIVGRRAPTAEFPTAENYVSVSIQANQLWELHDRTLQREAAQARALRQITTAGFTIRKYLERKGLYRQRWWRLSQIRRSMENPMEIAAIDEKMDELTVKIQEIEIGIEKAYADVANAVAEAGR